MSASVWRVSGLLPVAAAVCLLGGFLFWLLARRLEGPDLALATFALAVALPQILKYKHLEEWTGGVQGIVIMKPESPIATLFGQKMNSDRWLYFVTLAVTVLMFVIGWNLLRGRIGRALVAIRDQPVAAASMGIDNAMYKSLAFGVRAMFTGLAGALGPHAQDAAIWVELLEVVDQHLHAHAPPPLDRDRDAVDPPGRIADVNGPGADRLDAGIGLRQHDHQLLRFERRETAVPQRQHDGPAAGAFRRDRSPATRRDRRVHTNRAASAIPPRCARVPRCSTWRAT